ncbi:MAG: cell division protein FtsZ [Alphaproteobacteria bacterium]|nr:MAG: cell division protein FtsZ [Alphaproteobacteria bacterium]
MTLSLQLPIQELTMRPIITVVGVGGAGGNAVNNMISANLEGVKFVVANTDAQALDSALSDRTIQLGRALTQGLGAGATPQIGEQAAEEAAEDIFNSIAGSHMVFVTAGMGGGTGTGAAPVVARMARQQGMLTVGVVTKPFQFEGARRMSIAEQGIAELQKYVDTLIIIPNQNLFRLANEKTTFADAFRMADEVLHSGVRGVTDLMVKPGLVNLDFADIRTVMQEMGKAMMGTGEATGDKRALQAAEAAISNPLLDDVSLKGARAALINITGGSDMTLYEVDEAANRIRDEVDPDANIIFGSTFDESMQGTMRVSVVATGIDGEAVRQEMEAHANRGKPSSQAPAGSKATYKPTSAYYVGRKPQAMMHNAPTTPAMTRRDDHADDMNPPMMRQARPAPSAFSAPSTSSSASMRPTEQNVLPTSAQPVPQSFEASQDHGHHHHDLDSFADEIYDAPPAFVSPATPQQPPVQRQFQQPRQAAPQHHNNDHYAEHAPSQHAGSSSLNLLNRIADVGRSFSGRSQESQAKVTTGRNHDARHQGYEREEYRDQEEDSHYEIPAFLRRSDKNSDAS